MEDVDEESRRLITELTSIQNTLKPGSAEREQREDAIFKRLYQLAEIIKHDHSHDPRMREMFFLITEQVIPAPAPEVEQLPVYADEYKLFTRTQPQPKVQIFLEQMALDLKTMTPDEVRENLSDPSRDGQKEILNSFMGRCNRENWMKDGADHTCKNCWDEVMQRVFLMAAEMLTLEMKKRAEQIIQMTKHGHLTTEDARELAKFISKVMKKTEHLLETSEKRKKTKKEWIFLVESIFRLMVNLINEVMMRYFKMLKVKAAVRNSQTINDLIE